MQKILITSPSLHTSDNVSGIANLTRLVIYNNKDINYHHLITGKKDHESRNYVWFIKQLLLPIKFFLRLVNNHDIKICHINVPQEDFAIIREGVLILIAKFMRRKIIVHFRGGKYNMRKIEKAFIRIAFKSILTLSHKIISLSEIEKKYLVQYYNIDDFKIAVLPNAVRVSDGLSYKDYDGILKIIFLGRIEKDKGLDEIINTLKNLYTVSYTHLTLPTKRIV